MKRVVFCGEEKRVDYTWEVYNPVMGFKTFEADCPVSAIEKAAEYYDLTVTKCDIICGQSAVFGIRKIRSKKAFAFYSVSGHAIPVYTLDGMDEQNLDPILVTAFEEDYLKYVKKRKMPPAHPIWRGYNEA
jgi:hypothetical protein